MPQIASIYLFHTCLASKFTSLREFLHPEAANLTILAANLLSSAVPISRYLSHQFLQTKPKIL
jgi:hypothetical protein